MFVEKKYPVFFKSKHVSDLYSLLRYILTVLIGLVLIPLDGTYSSIIVGIFLLDSQTGCSQCISECLSYSNDNPSYNRRVSSPLDVVQKNLANKSV